MLGILHTPEVALGAEGAERLAGGRLVALFAVEAVRGALFRHVLAGLAIVAARLSRGALEPADQGGDGADGRNVSRQGKAQMGRLRFV